jgi:hypothetical protein
MEINCVLLCLLGTERVKAHFKGTANDIEVMTFILLTLGFELRTLHKLGRHYAA